MSINLSKQDLLDMSANFQKYALEKWTGEYCKIDWNIVSIKNSLIDSSDYYGVELNLSWKYWDFIVGSENAFSFKDEIWNISTNAVWLTLSWENVNIWKLWDMVSVIVFKYQDSINNWYVFVENSQKSTYKNSNYCTWSKNETISKQTIEIPQKQNRINNFQEYYYFWIITFLLLIIWILSFKFYKSKK